MKRREFIVGVGSALAAGSIEARAQKRPNKIRRIGILNGFDNVISNDVRVRPFKEELKALGWIEGENMQIDYREVPNPTALEAAATALVATKPEVILVMPTPAIDAIRRATRSIPVVFANTVDPVEGGFVTSVARPGSNITGFTSMEYSLGGKWLELLKEFAPATTRMLVLFVKENYTSRGLLRSIETAAQSYGIQITAAPVHDGDEIRRAFVSFGAQAGGGLLHRPTPSSPTTIDLSSNLPPRTACLLFIHFANTRWLVALCRTALLKQMCIDARLDMLIAYSRANSRAIYRCRTPIDLRWSSICRRLVPLG